MIFFYLKTEFIELQNKLIFLEKAEIKPQKFSFTNSSYFNAFARLKIKSEKSNFSATKIDFILLTFLFCMVSIRRENNHKKQSEIDFDCENKKKQKYINKS